MSANPGYFSLKLINELLTLFQTAISYFRNPSIQIESVRKTCPLSRRGNVAAQSASDVSQNLFSAVGRGH
jgi:hypothetical protein